MKRLHSVTLKGQDQWIQRFQWPIMQSNVFVKCAGNDTVGINISHMNSVLDNQ